MNKERLVAVRDAILAHPQLVNMSSIWSEEECGTAACIAGWACALSKQQEIPEAQSMIYTPAPIAQAQDWLELTDEQRFRLFLLSEHTDHECWPVRFEDRYLDAAVAARHKQPHHETAAQVVAERIDHFIATEGEE